MLIVDDDFRNIFALTALLERGKLNVLAAQSGAAALAMLEQRPDIDIVLMDIMMPVMNGYETMAAIRQRPKLAELPIIAVTGKVVGGERERCIAAGASDYISKPVDTAELLAALSEWFPARPTAGLARVVPRRPTASAAPPDRLGRRRSSWSTTTAASAWRSARSWSRSATPSSRPTSGEDALRAVLAQQFAVILMDVQMPTWTATRRRG